MSDWNEVQWASFAKSTKVLIWLCAVSLGALMGLILATWLGRLPAIGIVACGLWPFIGGDLLVYGDLTFWNRPMDERQQARFLLTAFGFVLVMAIIGAVGTYGLGWQDSLGPTAAR